MTRGEIKRSKRRRAFGLVLLLALSLLALPFVLHRREEVYTDGATVREPVADARDRVREVLWEPPRPVLDARGGVDLPPDEYEPCVSPFGDLIVFTRGRPGGDAGLWASRRERGRWLEPEPIAEIDTDADELGAAFSADGRWLYFYSDREGGRGGYDIWIAPWREDGRFGAPVPLGETINSAANEMSPAPDPSGERLYFTSDRDTPGAASGSWKGTVRARLHPVEYDVYSAEVRAVVAGGLETADPEPEAASPEPADPATASSEPAAQAPGDLAPPPDFASAVKVDAISRGSADGPVVVSPGGGHLYFASNRPGGAGGFDLYRVRLDRGRVPPPTLAHIESLGGPVNTEADELDPGLANEGYVLLFARTIEGRERLFESRSREVHVVLETGEPFWSLGWLADWLRRAPAWLVGLLISIITCLALLILFRRWLRSPNLLVRAFLIALLAHLLGVLWMYRNTVQRLLVEAIDEETWESYEIDIEGAPEEAVGLAIREAVAEASSELPPSLSTPETVPLVEAVRVVAPPVSDERPELDRSALSPSEPDDRVTFDLSLTEPIRPDASERREPAIEIPLPLAASRPVPNAAPPLEARDIEEASAEPEAASESLAESLSSPPVPARSAETTSIETPSLERESAERLPTPRGVDLELPPATPSSFASPVERPSPAGVGEASRARRSTNDTPEIALREPTPEPDREADRRGEASLQPVDPASRAPSRLELSGPRTRFDAPEVERLSAEEAPRSELPTALAANDQGPAVPRAPDRARVDVTPTLPPAGRETGALVPVPLSARSPLAGASEPTEGREALASRGAETPSAPSRTPVTRPRPREAEPLDLSGARPRVELPKPSLPGVDTRTLAARARAVPVPAIAVEGLEIGRLPARESSSRFLPRMHQLRGREQRAEAFRKGGGSEATERAVESGLAWLARHQSPDGRWRLDKFADHLETVSERDRSHTDWNGKGKRSSRGGGGKAARGDTAATGLALLAFLGHGDTHVEDGPFREIVERGLRWLVGAQKEDGDLRGGGNLYMHGVAAFALTEAYAFTRDPTLRGPAQAAIDFTARAQSPSLGGWRYDPHPRSSESDTSVFGWMLMALKSANLGGLEVDRQCLERAASYLASVRSGKQGGVFLYQPNAGRTSHAMTAQGLFAQRILADTLLDPTEREDPRILRAQDESIRQLLANLPVPKDQGDQNDRGANFYYWYYATLALFQVGGDAWSAWNERLSALLVELQVSEEHGSAHGSWDPRGYRAELGGRVYSTALSILCLEAYYRYAPLGE